MWRCRYDCCCSNARLPDSACPQMKPWKLDKAWWSLSALIRLFATLSFSLWIGSVGSVCSNLGLPDPHPDLLDTSKDPDPAPDPSIISKNSKKNLDFYCFVTSSWLFTTVPDPCVFGPSGSASGFFRKRTDLDPHLDPYHGSTTELSS